MINKSENFYFISRRHLLAFYLPTLIGIDLAPKTKRSESLAFTRNEPENVEGHVDTSEEALPSPDEITNDHIDQGGIDDS